MKILGKGLVVVVIGGQQVLARDGACCTFVGADGRRCGSTWRLELDHVIPVALGGASSAQNLQVLCGDCNRRKGASLG